VIFHWGNFSKVVYVLVICEIFLSSKGGAWPKWPNGKYAYGDRSVQKTNKSRAKTVANWVFAGPAHPLNPVLTKFGVWGGLPDVFLKFEFHDDRSINVNRSCRGRKLPFPIDKAHRLYNCYCCYRTSRDNLLWICNPIATAWLLVFWPSLQLWICSELSLRRPVKTNFYSLTACKHLILIQKLDVTPFVVHSVFPALNALNAAYDVEPNILVYLVPHHMPHLKRLEQEIQSGRQTV